MHIFTAKAQLCFEKDDPKAQLGFSAPDPGAMCPIFKLPTPEKMRNSLFTFFLILALAGLVACQSPAPQNNYMETQQALLFCPPQPHIKVYSHHRDSLAFEKAFDYISQQAEVLSTPQLITYLAMYFLETPYVGHTLEIPGQEQLVINLTQMDCTTFVEYVLAMALTARRGDHGFDSFAHTLACIRYRDGFPDGYPSRLHYFSEWLYSNTRKNILHMVSDSLGSQPFNSKVHFMSTHPHRYRQLQNNSYLENIREIETVVSSLQKKYIPKSEIHGHEASIHSGDIIAFASTIDGLDISHNGFAYHKDNRLYLIHASTRSMQVEITPVPLHEYLEKISNVNGILVARVNDNL